MPQLRLVKGRTQGSVREDVAGFEFEPSDEVHFGRPPNLAIGCMTALAGAAAAIVSRFIYFVAFDPISYFSWDWLLFLAAGGFVGFFLRIEKLILKDLERLSK